MTDHGHILGINGKSRGLVAAAALSILVGVMPIAVFGPQAGAAVVSCSGTPAWSASTVYAAPGNLVVRNSEQYRNNWWTQGNDPVTNSGGPGSGQPWTHVADCSDSGTTTTTTTKPTTTTTTTAKPTTTTTTTTVKPSDPEGLPNPRPFDIASTASGTLRYHLTLPYGTNTGATLELSSDYTDLIISNYVAGALLGHLIEEKAPGLSFSRDYVYGMLFAQLLQENIDTAAYRSDTDWINPDETARASLLAPGQGGPYQLNDYSKRLETSAGIGLVNFTALQKGLGFTVEAQDSGAQTASRGPDSLDQKYFGPMAAAYFHLNDMNRMAMNNAESWGPQYAHYAKCMANLATAPAGQQPYDMFDMILNAAYNAGTYSAILRDYYRLCAGMLGAGPESAQIASVGDYGLSDAEYQAAIGTTESAGSTFIIYPRQIRLYLDQMYNQDPVPGAVSIDLSMADVRAVFANAIGTLAHVDAAGEYGYVPPATSDSAFAAALAANGLGESSFLDLSVGAERARFFDLLDDAIGGVEAAGVDFAAVTQTTIGGDGDDDGGGGGGGTGPDCSSVPTYPAGRGTYISGTCVRGAADAALYVCRPIVAAWCNSTAEWAYAPGSGIATAEAWTKVTA